MTGKWPEYRHLTPGSRNDRRSRLTGRRSEPHVSPYERRKPGTSDKPPLKVLLCSPRGFCAGVDPRHPDRRAGAQALRRAGLCPPRDRAQPLRGRGPARPRARSSSRSSTKSRDTDGAGGLLRPRRAEVGAGGGRSARNFFYLDATCPLVSKVHSEAEIHHTPRPRDRADRPCRPSRGGRHAWASCRTAPSRWSRPSTDAEALRAARSRQPRLRHADHAVGRRHRRDRRARCKRRFPDDRRRRTRKTSATPPPTARRRSSAWRRRSMRWSWSARRTPPTRSGCRRWPSAPAAAMSLLVQRAAEIDWTQFGGIETLGVTAGASAPEMLVEEIIDAFAARYDARRRDRRRRATRSDVLPAAARSCATSQLTDRRHASRQRADAGRVAWPSTPTSPTTSSSASSPATISASCCPTRASPRASRTPTSCSTPSAGHYILTLYEKRVDAGRPAVLPRPDGASRRARHHLPAAGAATATARRSAQLCRPAGRASSPSSTACGCAGRTPRIARAVGEALARTASRRRRLSADARATRCRSTAGGRSTSRRARARRRASQPGLARRRSTHELDASRERTGRATCRRASSTPTCFPTTCSSSATSCPGLIDFYFACTDTLAYDVAICLNAWCFETDHSYNVTKGTRAARRLSDACGRCRAAERDALPLLARGAALRFLLTRLVRLAERAADGALVQPKDPLEYFRKLRFHQSVASAARLRPASRR